MSSSYDNATVVFDGYHGPSANDEEHRRPSSNYASAAVSTPKKCAWRWPRKLSFGMPSINKPSSTFRRTKWFELESMLSRHQEMRSTRFAEKVRAHRSCRNMSFLKFKSLVLFIKIVVKLLLLRPFGNLKKSSSCCWCFPVASSPRETTASNVYMVVENGTVCTTTIKRRVDVQLSESVFSPCYQLAAVIRPQGHIGSGKWGFWRNMLPWQKVL